jgi:hypothetical protein
MVKFNKNSILKNKNKKKHKKNQMINKKIPCLLKKTQAHGHEEE